ncbi:hypothetical protein AN220_23325, partial [Streptomyces nanshensis]
LSRFPVYQDTLDEVVGMVHLKDALAVPAHRRLHTPAARIALPALLVPQTLPVRPLLARLRSEQPIAVVVDEYGGTAGVVTLEDIVEEIVGEVRDEHDGQLYDELPELAPAPAEAEGRPAWEADGGCRVGALRGIGLEVPEGPYETVAGLVADLLGRIPVPGDTARLRVPQPRAGQDGPEWQLRVRHVAHHRAERVRIVAPDSRAATRPAAPAGPADGASRQPARSVQAVAS